MNFVGFRNAGSSGRTRVSVSTVATGRAIPRSKNTSPIVTWRRYPIRPWLSAPHTSRGIGDTVPAAASFWSRIRPTWGPLPWVTTTCQPAAAISATRSAAIRAFFRITSAESSSPRRRSALPPSAMTTRLTDVRLPEPLREDVGQLRVPLRFLELVPDPDRGPVEGGHLGQVHGGSDDHHVG